ncbi:MAG: endo alpha-1,4 polygalactosaminidase [Deltaproteobacteria bacterium]|nr:endo alpha-1,4 polygalactosaminidase [Deltaproteobacteria bacterium]
MTGKTSRRRYDLLIVHPDTNLTPTHVATLQAAGITVLCYLTVGEDDTLHTAAASDGRSGPADGYASWYYDADQNGRPDQNPDWGSYYTNASDPAWRAALRSYRNSGDQHWYGTDYLLNTLHCDGLFLDTIGTVRPAAWGGRYSAGLGAMLDLIAELRTQLGPNRLLVINRGLFYFDPYDAAANPNGLQEITPAMRDRLRGLINGLLYEEFMQEEHRDQWAARLNAEAQQPDGFTVFALDYLPRDAASTCATERALGWLPHLSTPALDTFTHVVREECP